MCWAPTMVAVFFPHNVKFTVFICASVKNLSRLFIVQCLFDLDSLPNCVRKERKLSGLDVRVLFTPGLGNHIGKPSDKSITIDIREETMMWEVF